MAYNDRRNYKADFRIVSVFERALQKQYPSIRFWGQAFGEAAKIATSLSIAETERRTESKNRAKQEELLRLQMAGTPEEAAARQKLHDLAMGKLPEIPLRGVAPVGREAEETTLAKRTAMEMISPQDIFQLPEVQGIIQEAMQKGNLLANRLGRALQASGNITSTTGRDVLGRAVTEVQKSIAASLAPFAGQERQRRADLIPLLAGLGLTEEERQRGITQEELDALFTQKAETAFLPSTYQKPFLESILGLQPAVQPFIPSQGGPSPWATAAPAIGAGIAALLQPKQKPAQQTVNVQAGQTDYQRKYGTEQSPGIYEGRA